MNANHKLGCTGKGWRHSGEGYNRVRVCQCGAEDHDPDPQAIERLFHFGDLTLALQLLADIDRGGYLRHSLRCDIYIEGLDCSCGLREIEERINAATEEQT